jgi:hypothetical protein
VIKLQLIRVLSYVEPVAVFLPDDHLFVLIIYLSIRTSQVKHTTTEPKVKSKLLYMQVGSNNSVQDKMI